MASHIIEEAKDIFAIAHSGRPRRNTAAQNMKTKRHTVANTTKEVGRFSSDIGLCFAAAHAMIGDAYLLDVQ